MALQKHESQDISTMATEIMERYFDPTQSLRTAMERRDFAALRVGITRAPVTAAGVAEIDEAVVEVRDLVASRSDTHQLLY